MTTPAGSKSTHSDSIQLARRTLLEGVGAEISASFPGITRLGGQVVAALYLADLPENAGLSMEALSQELGCSKSNVFSNLRALEAAGIVERRRIAGSRHDYFTLRGPYPDVIVGAYVARLRSVVNDKRVLIDRALRLLGEAQGNEAHLLRTKLNELGRKYILFSQVFNQLGSALDGPLDLEPLFREIPEAIVNAITSRLERSKATVY